MSIDQLLHKTFYLFFPYLESGLIQYYGEAANNIVLEALRKSEKANRGCLVGKFGTNELSAIIAYLYEYQQEPHVGILDIFRYNRGKYRLKSLLSALYTNAGMFPATEKEATRLCKRYLQDLVQIDLLGSYQRKERLLLSKLDCKFIHLNGYYAPFLYKEPWTQFLEGKRVLVISSFSESIRKQYQEKRSLLFENPKVLPEFSQLLTINAVQSMGGEQAGKYESWSQALHSMEQTINALKSDFDVALIGCGAYGLPLAAHIKRMNKIAIHLGGWIQMLFGIYGNRWINDQPEFAGFINPHWVRPQATEKPHCAQQVENACYW